MRKGAAIGLFGGSFNPAHGGHRLVSLEVMRRFGLDEVWWLVSPQNPLKPVAGMAPLAARLASARAVARHPRIRVTDLEARLGTQLTADTIAALRALHPKARFLWIMGADNLLQFHRWHDWRGIARMVPIVVVARPGYGGRSQFAPAMGWLRRFRRRSPAGWRDRTLPSLYVLPQALDPRSATEIRRADPRWAESLLPSSDRGAS
ncbi:nicotinate-nucleotide adenylyltransferase [Thermaurantiacus tibetensis]|uniref:nicotinate-nucleotide adenylyltransferase n=1 Tax=Thermaurantiacus tibetensis TaxID=2759035 RepID=UPI00188E9210|nr:nicotinate-nucleotide adenylyltransferase [Thermaurantiacus tibetensis]